MKELVEIQKHLKAPKNQRNNFGKYNYRSCEDILEAVKPLANKLECSVLLSDRIVLVGDRIYVEATATLFKDHDNEVSISVTALAREPLSQKGMNEAQITGSASSYARKYALNGLFAIDDTKDSDTDEYTKQTTKSSAKTVSKPKAKGRISDLSKVEAFLKKDRSGALKALMDNYSISKEEVKVLKLTKEEIKNLTIID
tara:strand:- start:427 stop:1023 length:597 start_codon:yes stop_codon:yes gene_type:complete